METNVLLQSERDSWKPLQTNPFDGRTNSIVFYTPAKAWMTGPKLGCSAIVCVKSDLRLLWNILQENPPTQQTGCGTALVLSAPFKAYDWPHFPHTTLSRGCCLFSGGAALINKESLAARRRVRSFGELHHRSGRRGQKRPGIKELRHSGFSCTESSRPSNEDGRVRGFIFFPPSVHTAGSQQQEVPELDTWS